MNRRSPHQHDVLQTAGRRPAASSAPGVPGMMRRTFDRQPILLKLREPLILSHAVPITSVALLAGSIALWVASLTSIEPRDFTDVGMIAALPPAFFASLLLLTASFSLALIGERVVWLLRVNIIAEVLILFGTPSFVEYGPRTVIAWRLAGVSDYITQNQSIDRGIDAFFNWPGFFIFISFITRALELESSLELARWAPIFFNLLYAFPLFVIFRKLAVSERQVWLALWLFFVTNWVGQDYLSPQALAYFIYLVIIAMVLTRFSLSVPGTDIVANSANSSRRLRVLTIGFVVLLFALLVPSHQLTPWLLTLSITGLVLIRRLPSYGLPLVMALIAATWIVFFTGPYLLGHAQTVAGPVGSLGSNVGENVGSRFEGVSPGHLFVVRFRIAFTLAIAAVAVWGGLRLRRAGAPVGTLAVLAAAPFVMLSVQSYGGEMLLRCYLFSLPFLTLFGAAVLMPLYLRRTLATLAAGTVILFVAGLGFLVARYGNERMDFFTKQEVDVVDFTYDTVVPKSQIFAATDNVPWRFKHYADYRYRTLDDSDVTEPSVSGVIEDLEDSPGPSYVLLTRSQFAAGRLLDGWPAHVEDRLRAALTASARFQVMYANDDAILLKLRAASSGDASR